MLERFLSGVDAFFSEPALMRYASYDRLGVFLHPDEVVRTSDRILKRGSGGLVISQL